VDSAQPVKPVGSDKPAGAGTPGLRDLGAMRREYHPARPGSPAGRGLDEADLPPHWLVLFEAWLSEAIVAHLPEPNAMILATASADGVPSARTVLLKAYDAGGFVFYTNYTSRKGTELAANPHASLVFPWHLVHRQVIVGGTVARVDRDQTEQYFATRPRDAQLGAWASPQSRPVATRQVLDRAWLETDQRFPAGEPVPAPPHWGGLRVTPVTVEFWQGRSGRLHDRLRYRRLGDTADPEADWQIERLAP
jgi:pyridoxamine 5'-phosphate oxidase